MLNKPSSYLLSDEPSIKKKLDKNRKRFYNEHIDDLNRLGIDDYSNLKSSDIVKVKKYTEIGIVGTEITTEILFPKDLDYYNYSAFSYDNKYFGYVGKPSSQGLIHLFKLYFNEIDKKLEVVDSYSSRHPSYASWVCGFSKTGYFATYDSTPNTYLINVNEELFNMKPDELNLHRNIYSNEGSIYHSDDDDMWNEIKGKNFLCFSPSGEYLALSEQGYEPLTLGGYGHQESNAIHIANTESGKIVDSFTGHGDEIKYNKFKKVIFVAFSEDERRIMSLSLDGVVIIRNIELKKPTEHKQKEEIPVANNV